jgi:hypothetical protein
VTTDQGALAAAEYLTLDELVLYSRLSIRTIHRLMTSDDPIPCLRIGRRLLFRRREFDVWLQRVGAPSSPSTDTTFDHRVAANVARTRGTSKH